MLHQLILYHQGRIQSLKYLFEGGSQQRACSVLYETTYRCIFLFQWLAISPEHTRSKHHERDHCKSLRSSRSRYKCTNYTLSQAP